jgi:hypothetical protein
MDLNYDYGDVIHTHKHIHTKPDSHKQVVEHSLREWCHDYFGDTGAPECSELNEISDHDIDDGSHDNLKASDLFKMIKDFEKLNGTYKEGVNVPFDIKFTGAEFTGAELFYKFDLLNTKVKSFTYCNVPKLKTFKFNLTESTTNIYIYDGDYANQKIKFRVEYDSTDTDLKLVPLKIEMAKDDGVLPHQYKELKEQTDSVWKNDEYAFKIKRPDFKKIEEITFFENGEVCSHVIPEHGVELKYDIDQEKIFKEINIGETPLTQTFTNNSISFWENKDYTFQITNNTSSFDYIIRKKIQIKKEGEHFKIEVGDYEIKEDGIYIKDSNNISIKLTKTDGEYDGSVVKKFKQFLRNIDNKKMLSEINTSTKKLEIEKKELKKRLHQKKNKFGAERKLEQMEILVEERFNELIILIGLFFIAAMFGIYCIYTQFNLYSI